jgi:hypothetical protein
MSQIGFTMGETIRGLFDMFEKKISEPTPTDREFFFTDEVDSNFPEEEWREVHGDDPALTSEEFREWHMREDDSKDDR